MTELKGSYSSLILQMRNMSPKEAEEFPRVTHLVEIQMACGSEMGRVVN